MSVYLDVIPKLDMGATRAVEREVMKALGSVSKSLERGLAPAVGNLFASSAASIKRDIHDLELDVSRAADAEVEAGRRMSRAADLVAVQRQRATEAAEKHGAASSNAMRAQMGLSDAQAMHGRRQRDYVDAMNVSEDATAGLGTAAETSAGSLAAMGGPIGAAVVAVGGLGIAWLKAADAAAPFQAQLIALNTAADVAASKLPQISRMVLNLAPQLGLKPTDLMGGAYLAAKSGYRNPQDMQKVLKAAGQMAAIEGVPLSEAVTAVTTQMGDYNMKPDQAALASSQIVAGAGSAKVPLADYVTAMHVAEPTASKMGIKAPQWMAMVSQVTQSGTNADVASQEVRSLLKGFQAPTSGQRGEWGALGLDPMQIKQEFIKDPLKAIQTVQDAVTAHTDKKTGLVNIDANYRNVQNTQSMQAMMANATPEQRAVMQQIESGKLTYKQWRKTRGGQNMSDVAKVQQYNSLYQTGQGYSQLLASGQGTQQTSQQAMAAVTGNQTSQAAYQQLIGEGNKKAKATEARIAGAKPDAKGNVAGSSAALNTYAANKAKLSATFGSLETEVGMAALPSATKALAGLKDVFQYFVDHGPAIGHALGNIGHAFTDVFGTLSQDRKGFDDVGHALGNIGHAGANVGHALGNVGHALGNVGHALGNVGRFFSGPTAAESKKWADDLSKGVSDVAHWFETLWDDTKKLTTELGNLVADNVKQGLSDLKRLAGDIATPFETAATWVGNLVGDIEKLPSKLPSWVQSLGGDVGKVGSFLGKHLAGGGGIYGGGAKGVDSVPALLAPGEHVLTAPDVDAMGGQNHVYAFRRALHMAGGGSPAGGDGASLWGTAASNSPLGTQSDPLYIQPTDTAAQQRAEKADARVQQLEEKLAALNADAKKSDVDKLKAELVKAKATADKAHAGAGGAGETTGAAGQLGAPLPDAFGLHDGLPGLAKWATTFAGDLAIAPLEGAITGAGSHKAMMNVLSQALPFFGGPKGSDTIPTYLSPGEDVIPKAGVSSLGLNNIARVNAGKPTRYKAGGGMADDQQLPAPGSGQQLPGQGQPASGGFGISGGAGAAAAGMFPGGGVAFQAAGRTVGLVGQLASIGVEGVLSTLIPSDSPLSNFSNTLPGKLLSGIAGVRPAAPNAAGKTKAPLEDPKSKNNGDTTHNAVNHQQNGGVHISGPVTVKNAGPKADGDWHSAVGAYSSPSMGPDGFSSMMY